MTSNQKKDGIFRRDAILLLSETETVNFLSYSTNFISSSK